LTIIFGQAEAMTVSSRVSKGSAKQERIDTFTLNVAANLLEWKEEEWDEL